MIKEEILDDLRILRKRLKGEERLDLDYNSCSQYDIDCAYQDLVIEWIESDGIYEYTTHLTKEEKEKDSEDFEITNEYIEYLRNNEL